MNRDLNQVDFTQRTRGVDMLSSMDKQAQLELQLWASYRAQTLARTIRGMMYYEQAVKMLAVVRQLLDRACCMRRILWLR